MYEVLKARLMQGGYTLEDGEWRIGYLVAAGQITPEQAEALHGIAVEHADAVSAVEMDVAEIKQAAVGAAVLLEAMRPAVQHVAAETYTDAQLTEAAVLFDAWTPGAAYAAGTVVRHGDTLYRVLADVTALSHQEPGGSGMLSVYAPVQMRTPEDEEAGVTLPWISGETGLKVGDRREYNGIVYEALQPPGANTWTPDSVPALWKAV